MVISIIGFVVDALQPQSAVDNYITDLMANRALSGEQKALLKTQMEERLGLNLPLFYLTFSSLAEKQNIKTSTYKNYLPAISFNYPNRYHRWLFGYKDTTGLLGGNFGQSYYTKKPVSTVLATRLPFTISISLLSVFLAYLISTPLGVWAAKNKNNWKDRTSGIVLFMLYALPTFWVATLLLFAFANPDVLYWFEASGIKPAEGYPPNATWWNKLHISLPYLVLPLVTFTYGSMSFMARTLRGEVIESTETEYYKTARSKGLSTNKALWNHAFRNSLLPLITLLSNIFPTAIAGSVIIETVFTLPGMGYETYTAILRNDFPIIIAVLTITALLTAIGLVVQDVLYAWADPRITFNKKN